MLSNYQLTYLFGNFLTASGPGHGGADVRPSGPTAGGGNAGPSASGADYGHNTGRKGPSVSYNIGQPVHSAGSVNSLGGQTDNRGLLTAV